MIYACLLYTSPEPEPEPEIEVEVRVNNQPVKPTEDTKLDSLMKMMTEHFGQMNKKLEKLEKLEMCIRDRYKLRHVYEEYQIALFSFERCVLKFYSSF